MNTRLVIFDLDGTLLDTIDDLASAVDHVLAVESLPRHTREEYRMMVGGGIRKLIFRALPETMRSDAFIDKCLSRFVDYYSDNIDRLTHPYPGIGRVLSQLESHGIAMAVASNKFQLGTERLVGRFFPNVRFVAVAGNCDGLPLKPDPAVVDRIIAAAGVERCQTVMVGDSGVDMSTARNASIRAIGVTWGFRSREELASAGADSNVSTADELLDAIISPHSQQ